MTCPVCGGSAISWHPLKPGETLTFPEVYYGPQKVCFDGVYLYAHGERL